MNTSATQPTSARPTAVLYLRVSTVGQVKTDYDPEGISIPAQREACLRKAEQLGAVVVHEFIEPGKSGTNMDKRPAFQAMLERIRAERDIDYVIVYKLSRMNRNRIDDALVLTSLRKYKATLISATESIDETPVGQLMHGILASFNEYRSAEDGADIRYKMGEKAKKGGTLGRAPMGYLNHRERFEGREVRTIIIDPERAPFIPLAFELYATGQYTLQDLADELTARGLRGRPGRYPARPVTDTKLATMLRERYYLGIVTYQGVEYPGRHPALVTQELFDRVQSVLAASGHSGERRRRHDNYLKGTVWCQRCHEAGRRGRLILNKATGRQGVDYFYFLCRGRQTGTCTLPYMAMEQVEDAVEAYWATQQLPAEFIDTVRRTLQTTLDEANASARLLRDQLSTELARIDRQEENLLDLVADGQMAADKVRTRLTRLQQERAGLHGRRDTSEERLAEGAAVLDAQLDLLRDPQELYRQLGDHGRRLLNQAMFEELRIDVDEDPRPVVAGQDYTAPVQTLLAVAAAHRAAREEADATTHDSRLAVNGEPASGTLTDRLHLVFLDEGWSKAAMVGLISHNTNTGVIVSGAVVPVRAVAKRQVGGR